MSESYLVARQDETTKTKDRSVQSSHNSFDTHQNDYNPMDLHERQMAQFVNHKNAKRFTHLYELEKYFR